jgi:hypothetical protein
LLVPAGSAKLVPAAVATPAQAAQGAAGQWRLVTTRLWSIPVAGQDVTYLRFSGSGHPMQAMIETAVLDGATNSSLMLMVQTPDCAYYDGAGAFKYAQSYVCIPDGLDFIDRVYPAMMDHAQRHDYDLHVFELIQGRRPVKPCFDFDYEGGLPGCFADRADFQAKITAAITQLFCNCTTASS